MQILATLNVKWKVKTAGFHCLYAVKSINALLLLINKCCYLCVVSCPTKLWSHNFWQLSCLSVTELSPWKFQNLAVLFFSSFMFLSIPPMVVTWTWPVRVSLDSNAVSARFASLFWSFWNKVPCLGELVERLLTNYHKHGRPLRDVSKRIQNTWHIGYPGCYFCRHVTTFCHEKRAKAMNALESQYQKTLYIWGLHMPWGVFFMNYVL